MSNKTSDQTNSQSEKSRRSGVQAPAAIGRAMRHVTAAALGKVGQSFAQLLSHWPQVVGAELARKCLPTALNFPRGKNADAVLHLATNSAFALELAHQTPLLLERVNAFLGYRAISELRFDHTQLPASMTGKLVMPAVRGGAGQAMSTHTATLPEPVPAEVCQIYSGIQDPELRARLESLCRTVASAA